MYNSMYIHTDPPGAPGEISVTEVGGDFVSLQWERPRSDGGGPHHWLLH